MWNRGETIIDDIFSYIVAIKILNDDCEPHNIDDCRQRFDLSNSRRIDFVNQT